MIFFASRGCDGGSKECSTLCQFATKQSVIVSLELSQRQVIVPKLGDKWTVKEQQMFKDFLEIEQLACFPAGLRTKAKRLEVNASYTTS